ncbi:hypothetical protein [Fructilactobacillus florum]|uniref:hypothetical protein n=1 Tax=Fructilactobacillus florum TaxID=640331 RepID=UPI000B1D4722|nr:hypothetical protein [Fructilactobacillus florum]
MLDKNLENNPQAVLNEDKKTNLRLLKATEYKPVTKFKGAKAVTNLLNNPDEE